MHCFMLGFFSGEKKVLSKKVGMIFAFREQLLHLCGLWL